MVPGTKRFPQLKATCSLQVVPVGSSRLTGIVTRACRPSGYKSHHREPPHLSEKLHMSDQCVLIDLIYRAPVSILIWTQLDGFK